MSLRAIIYCPLYEELKEIQKVFPSSEDLTGKYGFVAYRSAKGQFDLIVASQDEMGVSTANATIRAIKPDFQPHLVICIGIAGSLSDDVTLGDVCFTQEVLDINENQKVENGKTAYQPKAFGSNRAIDRQIGMAEVHETLSEEYRRWQRECEASFREDTADLPETFKEKFKAEPIAKRGPIVCGPVVADKKFKTKLKGINRKVLAIETETSGIYQALDRAEPIEILAVRGISDLADETKKVTEVGGKQVFRRVAARNAAGFLAMSLEHNFLLANSLTDAAAPLLQGVVAPATDPIETILKKQSAIIEHCLNELSPEYRAKEKGYVLPVPRVKPAMEAAQPSTPMEPLELVSSSTAAVIDVPISYPDKGLPWLYAKQLLGTTMNGKIVVPLVINADKLRPPVHGLMAEIEANASDLLKVPQILPVIILTEMTFNNERKATLILEEARNSHLTTVLFGNGAQKAFFTANPKFEAWQNYSLCDVSFSSIVNFLSAQFHIEMPEAEVIAIRLSNTFRAFNLSAHPSYFAGIPKEMLARLSDANHRAELIDLAVTGFLSFIGAGDTKDVTLKQRTRRLFLRDLAYQIVVLKENFSVERLVGYVKEYSAQHDFGLPALEFVQSFIQNGILHEKGDRIEFSIDFIENYLVAERLAAEPHAARKYFDPNLNEIDFSTFELYAEIGLSKDVLDDVTNRLETAISSFSSLLGESEYTRTRSGRSEGTYRSNGHPFVSGVVKPRMLSNVDKLVHYHDKVERSAREIVGSRSNIEGKQRVLDMAQSAREGVQAQRKVARNGHEAPGRPEIGRDWLMAVVLLGSAAEELQADVKRKLASRIVTLSALICDDWLRLHLNQDLSEMREALFESALEYAKEDSATPDEAQVRELVDLVVDVAEMGAFFAPLGQVTGTIAEYARNRVLFESLKNVAPEDVVEELFLSLWKMELREADGLTAYRETLTKLPKDHFLRIMLATYLVDRSYWYRASDAGRAIFADAVELTLKPLSLKLSVDRNIDLNT